MQRFYMYMYSKWSNLVLNNGVGQCWNPLSLAFIAHALPCPPPILPGGLYMYSKVDIMLEYKNMEKGSFFMSFACLFADDCVVYRPISSPTDCEILQQDLKSLEKWEERWTMSFKPDKCNILHFTRKKSSTEYSYKLS